MKTFRRSVWSRPKVYSAGVFWLILAGCSQAPDAVIDLDLPPKFKYVERAIPVPVGSKPGQLGVRTWSKKESAAMEDEEIGMPDLKKPERIVFDRDGNLFIDDWVNARIEKYDKDGKFLEIVTKYPLDEEGYGPDLSIGPNGHVFLTGRAVDGTWEIAAGRLVGKRKEYETPELWPPRPDRKSVFRSLGPNMVEIMMDAAPGAQRRFILETDFGFGKMPPREWSAWSGHHAYLWLILEGPQINKMILDVNLDDFGTRLMEGQSLWYPGVTEDGIMYKVNCGASGKGGSSPYYCEIVKMIPEAR